VTICGGRLFAVEVTREALDLRSQFLQLCQASALPIVPSSLGTSSALTSELLSRPRIRSRRPTGLGRVDDRLRCFTLIESLATRPDPKYAAQERALQPVDLLAG
jgi:hypothetical protein